MNDWKKNTHQEQVKKKKQHTNRDRNCNFIQPVFVQKLVPIGTYIYFCVPVNSRRHHVVSYCFFFLLTVVKEGCADRNFIFRKIKTTS